jgi:signal peptidase I
MEPALRHGDRLMLKKMVGELKRGDIVAFRYPMDTSKSFVKRIIALPGETISIDTSGAVYINNTELPEPYVSPERNRSPKAVAKTTLASGEYFVMGDGRDASNDSRSFGPVDRNLIYGTVMGRYWPITR